MALKPKAVLVFDFLFMERNPRIAMLGADSDKLEDGYGITAPLV